MPLGSINHIGITVDDLPEAMKFFKPLLQFVGYNVGPVIQDPDGQHLTVT
jgi:hypothetical protein